MSDLTEADRRAMRDLLDRAPTPEQEAEHRAAAESLASLAAPRLTDRPGVRTESLGWADD